MTLLEHESGATILKSKSTTFRDSCRHHENRMTGRTRGLFSPPVPKPIIRSYWVEIYVNVIGSLTSIVALDIAACIAPLICHWYNIEMWDISNDVEYNTDLKSIQYRKNARDFPVMHLIYWCRVRMRWTHMYNIWVGPSGIEQCRSGCEVFLRRKSMRSNGKLRCATHLA